MEKLFQLSSVKLKYTIVALTDSEGKVVEEISYDKTYGKVLNHTIQEENLTLNPYGYTGREMDAEDLYYYRARYYDPQTQRFLSKDPIEFQSGDFNHYRYVGNDCVNFVDPSGLEGCECKVIRNTTETVTSPDNHVTMTPFEHANSQAIAVKNRASMIDAAKKIGPAAGKLGIVATAVTLWAPNPVSATIAAGAGACSLATDGYLVSEGEQDIKETVANVVLDKIPLTKFLPKKFGEEIQEVIRENNNLNTDINSTSVLDF